MAENLVRMRDIVKQYDMGGEPQIVLDHINFDIDTGDFISLLGPSGSGKSTMMNILGCLDVPTGGTYMLGGRDVTGLDEEEMAHVRNKQIGFIFQSFHLLTRMTALQNVEIPLIYARVSPAARRKKAADILSRVGLADRMDYYPNQLSGGQQQRVAIARSLVTEPQLLLADEPTGALDQKTGKQVMALFHELHDEGHTILMITHDANIAAHGSRIVRILDGRMAEGEEAELHV